MSDTLDNAADIGVKRARGLETDNFISKVKEMVQATMIDPQVVDLKKALQNAKNENDNLRQQLTKAKMQYESTQEKVKELKKDNDKKDLKNYNLLKMAKRYGDCTLTEFLASNPTDTEAVASLQHRLNHILTTMNNNNTLDDFVNEHQRNGDKTP
eukprot:1981025-Rhodomonas_salina.1